MLSSFLEISISILSLISTFVEVDGKINGPPTNRPKYGRDKRAARCYGFPADGAHQNSARGK